ncbi:MAG: transcriptional regulator with XRE-family HTH domain [Candidatus Omnitrophota bacterium]|jgi:transcriptional regulator with XRE-family HTH domain
MYKSVSEMIKDELDDDSFKELLLADLGNKRLSKLLFLLRCQKNLTQKQLSKLVGCTQGKISKIESASDADLSVKDLLDYSKALDLQLEIGYRHKSVKLVDLIKYHVFKIKEYLDRLAKLAKDDASLTEGVGRFYLEAFVNLNNIVSESFSSLKLKKAKALKDHDTIHITAPLAEVHSKEKLPQ